MNQGFQEHSNWNANSSLERERERERAFFGVLLPRENWSPLKGE